MKVTFDSQGKVKMAKKWLHKNVNIAPKRSVTWENFF